MKLLIVNSAALMAGAMAVVTATAAPTVLAAAGPKISFNSPTNSQNMLPGAGFNVSLATSDHGGEVTNVTLYLGDSPVYIFTKAPYELTIPGGELPPGQYTLSAVATDNAGLSATSSPVHISTARVPSAMAAAESETSAPSSAGNLPARNLIALAALKQIKTVFVIPLENHDLVQPDPTGRPQQLLGNPACPYFNSLITPGNSNSVQTAWATHYFSVAITGEHPSEPNYIWSEAGTDFGVRTDNDPSKKSHNIFRKVMHLSAQLTAAGVPWKDYQEDLQFSRGPTHSAYGASSIVNPYNGTTQYSYAAKHNPMAFFPDTWTNNVYPLTNLWADLEHNNVGRYNWVTPDQYNEMHSALPRGFTYHGKAWTGNQAAIAEGDNALSIIIPRIMKSRAYQDHGVIIIWTDETESTDNTNTTLPCVIISPLAKGNAYASTMPYNHSSDLKTMDEIFGLAWQTNAIPRDRITAEGSGYNYVDGRSAVINDFSDFFKGVGLMITNQPAPVAASAGETAGFSVGAMASSPVACQWYFGARALAGQTNSILNLKAVTPADAGNYHVTVTSADGRLTSRIVTLKVSGPAEN